jgi:hypothetical protein
MTPYHVTQAKRASHRQKLIGRKIGDRARSLVRWHQARGVCWNGMIWHYVLEVAYKMGYYVETKMATDTTMKSRRKAKIGHIVRGHFRTLCYAYKVATEHD